MRWLAAILLSLAISIGANHARAETLIASLSTHRVLIASNFTGADLVLFGTIERDAVSVSRPGAYDIVVTITGPRESFSTWRKDRMLGIWVNRESRTIVGAPAYLAVLSTRALTEITDEETLRRLETGILNVALRHQVAGKPVLLAPDDPFRFAYLRIQTANEFYRELANGVTFLTPSVFRSGVRLPADIPIGSYEVDVKLFAGGVMVARQGTAFEVVKVGFEQFVTNAAREHGLIYGFATASLALLTGWLASIIFRRN